MELEIYQTIFMLTTLFSGSDARPAARQTAMIGLRQSSAVSIVLKLGHSIDRKTEWHLGHDQLTLCQNTV